MKPMSKDERLEILGILKTRHQTAIDAINAADPGWRKSCSDKANKLAIGRLKIEKEVTELETVEEDIRKLEAKREELEAKIHKKMPLNERDKYDSCPTPKHLCEAVGEIVEEVMDSVLANDLAGKKSLAADEDFNTRRELLALCSTREDLVEKKVLES